MAGIVSDLKAKWTRSEYGTYLNYLDSIKEEWPEYMGLYRYLKNVSDHGPPGFRVVIQDISVGGKHLTPSDFVFNLDLSIDEFALKRIEVMEHLSRRSDNIRTRLILVENRTKGLHPTLIDMIGLSLDIEPLFFCCVLEDNDILPRFPQYLRMNPMVIKIFDGDDSERPRPQEVLAIFQESIYMRPLGPIFRFYINEPPRLHTGNAYKHTRSNASHHTHILDIFVNMMQAQISRSSTNDLHDCLILMTRLYHAHFMQYIHEAVDLYRRWKRDQSLGIQSGEKHDVERLYQLWCAFREELEDFKASTRASSRFIDRSCSSSKDPRALQQLQSQQDEAWHAADTLEIEIRERLQIKVSRSSLEESRKSIEEGKIVKLLTVLAFGFIPVSLTSSIFGMNIQEINNSGKSLWVFVVTALVLTALAIGLWVLSNAILTLQKEWRLRPNEGIRWRFRFRDAIWLLLHPTAGRGVCDGIVLALLTDGRLGYQGPEVPESFVGKPSLHIAITRNQMSSLGKEM